MEDIQFIHVKQKIETTNTRQTFSEIKVVQAIYAIHVIEVIATQLQKVIQIMGLFKPRRPSRS